MFGEQDSIIVPESLCNRRRYSQPCQQEVALLQTALSLLQYRCGQILLRAIQPGAAGHHSKDRRWPLLNTFLELRCLTHSMQHDHTVLYRPLRAYQLMRGAYGLEGL